MVHEATMYYIMNTTKANLYMQSSLNFLTLVTASHITTVQKPPSSQRENTSELELGKLT